MLTRRRRCRPPAAAAAVRPPGVPQVLLPVGEAPEAVFQRYASLIVRHRQVELTNVRSFYKEAQKSPFKFFPWKTGNMHFKFLPVRMVLGCRDGCLPVPASGCVPVYESCLPVLSVPVSVSG